LRRLVLAGLALLVVPALALAGATATEGTNTLRIKAKVTPPKASKKSQPRPIGTKYDYVAGTTDGRRIPDLRRVTVHLGGAKYGFGAFPKCDETDARTQGAKACPKGSRVGKGTAVAEIRMPESTTSKSNLKAKVKVYNGSLDTDRNGRPMAPREGLLLYAEVDGAKLAIGFWSEKGGRQVSYYNPKDDPYPGADALYAIKEIHVTIRRRSRKQGGKRVPFLAAPTGCKDGKWIVSTTNAPYDGEPITATHAVRCKPATKPKKPKKPRQPSD
jgi:hypothetical protein